MREDGKKPARDKYVGRQIAFSATVLMGEGDPRVRIHGANNLAIAAIHNVPKSVKLSPNQEIKVRGLVVDRWYDVWQIWCYEVKPGLD